MRVEAEVKESSKKKSVRSTWAGDIEKMGDENWQRADAQKAEGKWRRGRPILRWGIALK